MGVASLHIQYQMAGLLPPTLPSVPPAVPYLYLVTVERPYGSGLWQQWKPAASPVTISNPMIPETLLPGENVMIWLLGGGFWFKYFQNEWPVTAMGLGGGYNIPSWPLDPPIRNQMESIYIGLTVAEILRGSFYEQFYPWDPVATDLYEIYPDEVVSIDMIVSGLYLTYEGWIWPDPLQSGVNQVIWLGGAESPFIEVQPAALSFIVDEGTDQASQFVNIRNANDGDMDYSIAWVSNQAPVGASNPPTGRSTGPSDAQQHDWMVWTAELPGGFSGVAGYFEITAPGASNSPLRVFVSITVIPTQIPSHITFTPASMTMEAQEGGERATGNITVGSSTGGAMWVELIPSDPRLVVYSNNPQIYSDTSLVFLLEFDHTGLAIGTYNYTVDIISDEADNSPQQVPVTVNVIEDIPPGPPAARALELGFAKV